MDVELSVHWRVGQDKAEDLGQRLLPLLVAIRDQGSLRQAAEQLRISYRNAWDLLRQRADQLGAPLVHMHRGRGARLTALGEKLLSASEHAEDRMSSTLAELATEIRAELEAVLTPPLSGPLIVFASHSLAHEILRSLIQQMTNVQLQLHHHGSLESLKLLRDGRCDLAGFHIANGELRKRLARQYRPLLDIRQHKLITVTARRQGLITARGNPKRINNLDDLVRQQARFINRQPDSGTRLLFDALLRKHGIQTDRINGYHDEEFTHLAVGALLASNTVDAGFGLEAAADKFGLDFIPFATETYYFAVPKQSLANASVRDLISVLTSREFRQRVSAMRGYDASHAGELVDAEL